MFGLLDADWWNGWGNIIIGELAGVLPPGHLKSAGSDGVTQHQQGFWCGKLIVGREGGTRAIMDVTRKTIPLTIAKDSQKVIVHLWSDYEYYTKKC